MAGTLHIETLRGYLSNAPLVQVIRQKREINEARNRLLDAQKTLADAGISAAVIQEVLDKADEYGKISRGYSEMIESVWGISWQTESLITKYLDCCDVDDLPEYVKL